MQQFYSTKRNIFLFFSFFLSIIPLQAQFFDDLIERSAISVSYGVNDKVDLSATYYNYLKNNLTQYDKSVVAGKITYKPMELLGASVDYRYGIGLTNNYQDIRYSLVLTPKLSSSRWNVSFFPTLQHKIIPDQKQALLLRNLLKANYKTNDRFRISAFTENYLDTKNNFKFDTQRSALGSIIRITEKSNLNLHLLMFNKANNVNLLQLEAIYSLRIN